MGLMYFKVAFVMSMKTTNTDNKRIGLSLNPKHETNGIIQKHKS
jgi:hypothetical protein